jgi:uncharacterized membrane protein YgcG
MSRSTVLDPAKRVMMVLLSIAMMLGVGASLASCSSDDDAQTVAPSAFVSPADGKTYCRWVNIRSECEGSPYPAAVYPMPQDQPVRDPGMSAMDFLVLNALFQDSLMYHSYYYRPWYYNNYIGPAWSRHPGYVEYGYGHRPVTRITTVNNYNTTINHVNTKYGSQERSAESKAVYKTANGKTYKGNTVPSNAFKGTNVPVNSPAAKNAPTKATTPSNTTPSGKKINSGSSTPSGKSYSGSSSSSRSSGSSSSSSSSRSSGGSSSSSRSGK